MLLVLSWVGRVLEVFSFSMWHDLVRGLFHGGDSVRGLGHLNRLVTPTGVLLYDGMKRQHPGDVEVASFGFIAWNSIEEATSNCTLRAQDATEWRRYLEDNGRAFRDNC